MNSLQATVTTRFKVGLFTIGMLGAIAGVTVFVNTTPYWWRPCQFVRISVEDATGLKTRSPVKSLGLQIGYLKGVELQETQVLLGICITAPIEILPKTRAYIRGEGFLGDKFVELRPVKYIGKNKLDEDEDASPTPEPSNGSKSSSGWLRGILIRNADAAEEFPARRPVQRVETVDDPAPVLDAKSPAADNSQQPAGPVRGGVANPRPGRGRAIPVGENSQDFQQLVGQVNGMVGEIKELTNNLKQGLNPEEMRQTVKQLNRALENASRTLSPEGGLNTTAQRTLAKLEDAIEQLRDMLTRVNRGEGSVGMVLNDPSYAEEVKSAIRNVNRMLGRVDDIRLVVNVGAEQLGAYNGGRGWGRIAIWPNPTRYYLLGMAVDPRGRITSSTSTTDTTTSAGTTSVTTKTTTTDATALQLTGMLGKVFWNRLDLAIGFLNGDGTISANVWFGPTGAEDRFRLLTDFYARGAGTSSSVITARVNLYARLWFLPGAYIKGGLESVTPVNGALAWSAGAGITFDDEDIRMLFAFIR